MLSPNDQSRAQAIAFGSIAGMAAGSSASGSAVSASGGSALSVGQNGRMKRRRGDVGTPLDAAAVGACSGVRQADRAGSNLGVSSGSGEGSAAAGASCEERARLAAQAGGSGGHAAGAAAEMDSAVAAVAAAGAPPRPAVALAAAAVAHAAGTTDEAAGVAGSGAGSGTTGASIPAAAAAVGRATACAREGSAVPCAETAAHTSGSAARLAAEPALPAAPAAATPAAAAGQALQGAVAIVGGAASSAARERAGGGAAQGGPSAGAERAGGSGGEGGGGAGGDEEVARAAQLAEDERLARELQRAFEEESSIPFVSAPIGEHMFGTNKRDKNVAMCKSDYAKQLRATADQERSTMENATGGSTRASTSSVEAPRVRRSRQRDIRDMTDQVAHNRLDYLWAAAVAENDLAFNVSKSKSIQAFVDAVIMYAKPYTLPTPYKVSGPLLDKLKADSEDLLRPVKESWKTSGCSLSVDGWTDIKSRGFVCVIAQNDTAPVIVDIVDSKTVIMLGRFLEVKRALRAMVISEEWEDVAVARTEEGMEVRKLLLDDVFWDCGTAVHRLMTPIYEVLRAVDTRAQVMGQLYGLMLEATVKTNAAAETAAAHFIKRTGLLLPKDRSTFLTSIKAIIARRNDKEIRKGVDEVIQARGGDVQQRITLAAQVAQFHRGEGRLGSDDARWAATTLVEAGRMTEAEWWFLFGGEVQALQDLAVTSLSQPVTSSEVERYWSALTRVQRRDRNRLTAKKMTDVTFVAFTRRARDAFDRKAALRSKLYQDLGNGTLREGAAIIPAEVEVEEGDAEEEAPVEEECTIDWSEFGSIGKKRKGKAGKSSKGKKRGKGNGACKGKGKGKAGDAEEEEEAEESGGEEEEPALNPKGRYAWDCSDGSSGEEEEEEEDDEEYDGAGTGDGLPAGDAAAGGGDAAPALPRAPLLPRPSGQHTGERPSLAPSAASAPCTLAAQAGGAADAASGLAGRGVVEGVEGGEEDGGGAQRRAEHREREVAGSEVVVRVAGGDSAGAAGGSTGAGSAGAFGVIGSTAGGTGGGGIAGALNPPVAAVPPAPLRPLEAARLARPSMAAPAERATSASAGSATSALTSYGRWLRREAMAETVAAATALRSQQQRAGGFGAGGLGEGMSAWEMQQEAQDAADFRVLLRVDGVLPRQSARRLQPSRAQTAGAAREASEQAPEEAPERAPEQATEQAPEEIPGQAPEQTPEEGRREGPIAEAAAATDGAVATGGGVAPWEAEVREEEEAEEEDEDEDEEVDEEVDEEIEMVELDGSRLDMGLLEGSAGEEAYMEDMMDGGHEWHEVDEEALNEVDDAFDFDVALGDATPRVDHIPPPAALPGGDGALPVGVHGGQRGHGGHGGHGGREWGQARRGVPWFPGRLVEEAEQWQARVARRWGQAGGPAGAGEQSMGVAAGRGGGEGAGMPGMGAVSLGAGHETAEAEAEAEAGTGVMPTASELPSPSADHAAAPSSPSFRNLPSSPASPSLRNLPSSPASPSFRNFPSPPHSPPTHGPLQRGRAGLHAAPHAHAMGAGGRDRRQGEGGAMDAAGGGGGGAGASSAFSFGTPAESTASVGMCMHRRGFVRASQLHATPALTTRPSSPPPPAAAPPAPPPADPPSTARAQPHPAGRPATTSASPHAPLPLPADSPWALGMRARVGEGRLPARTRARVPLRPSSRSAAMGAGGDSGGNSGSVGSTRPAALGAPAILPAFTPHGISPHTISPHTITLPVGPGEAEAAGQLLSGQRWEQAVRVGALHTGALQHGGGGGAPSAAAAAGESPVLDAAAVTGSAVEGVLRGEGAVEQDVFGGDERTTHRREVREGRVGGGAEERGNGTGDEAGRGEGHEDAEGRVGGRGEGNGGGNEGGSAEMAESDGSSAPPRAPHGRSADGRSWHGRPWRGEARQLRGREEDGRDRAAARMRARVASRAGWTSRGRGEWEAAVGRSDGVRDGGHLMGVGGGGERGRGVGGEGRGHGMDEQSRLEGVGMGVGRQGSDRTAALPLHPTPPVPARPLPSDALPPVGAQPLLLPSFAAQHRVPHAWRPAGPGRSGGGEGGRGNGEEAGESGEGGEIGFLFQRGRGFERDGAAVDVAAGVADGAGMSGEAGEGMNRSEGMSNANAVAHGAAHAVSRPPHYAVPATVTHAAATDAHAMPPHDGLATAPPHARPAAAAPHDPSPSAPPATADLPLAPHWSPLLLPSALSPPAPPQAGWQVPRSRAVGGRQGGEAGGLDAWRERRRGMGAGDGGERRRWREWASVRGMGGAGTAGAADESSGEVAGGAEEMGAAWVGAGRPMGGQGPVGGEGEGRQGESGEQAVEWEGVRVLGSLDEPMSEAARAAAEGHTAHAADAADAADAAGEDTEAADVHPALASAALSAAHRSAAAAAAAASAAAVAAAAAAAAAATDTTVGIAITEGAAAAAAAAGGSTAAARGAAQEEARERRRRLQRLVEERVRVARHVVEARAHAAQQLVEARAQQEREAVDRRAREAREALERRLREAREAVERRARQAVERVVGETGLEPGAPEGGRGAANNEDGDEDGGSALASVVAAVGDAVREAVAAEGAGRAQRGAWVEAGRGETVEERRARLQQRFSALTRLMLRDHAATRPVLRAPAGGNAPAAADDAGDDVRAAGAAAAADGHADAAAAAAAAARAERLAVWQALEAGMGGLPLSPSCLLRIPFPHLTPHIPCPWFSYLLVSPRHTRCRSDYEMLLALDDISAPVVRPGATPDEINSLPTALVTAHDSDLDPCAICIEVPSPPEVIRRLPCSHAFHRDCIDEWLRRRAVCPICKRDTRGAEQ
ncbi:unnamed protein product [Closterium sp. NIES-64]|nr:unnamed protein product [Closterium sp. NIES-64]